MAKISDSKNLLPLFLNIPTFKDLRGSLSFLESYHHFPFEIDKIEIHSSTGNFEKNHIKLGETASVIIFLKGFGEITTKAGQNPISFMLNEPKKALLIPPRLEEFKVKISNDFTFLLLHSKVKDKEEFEIITQDFLNKN